MSHHDDLVPGLRRSPRLQPPSPSDIALEPQPCANGFLPAITAPTFTVAAETLPSTSLPASTAPAFVADFIQPGIVSSRIAADELSPLGYNATAVTEATAGIQQHATSQPERSAYLENVESFIRDKWQPSSFDLKPKATPTQKPGEIHEIRRQIDCLELQLNYARSALRAAETERTQMPFKQVSGVPFSVSNVSTSSVAPRMICDLPDFDGNPEDWPMFIAAFHHSSLAYRYSEFENSLRLQKALKGKARESVKSLLIHPNNVSDAIRHLEFRFGRPAILIKHQIENIRKIPPISETALSHIVSLATRTQNLAAFLQTAGGEQHLTSPTLLEELVLKLPMSKRLEWARHALSIKPYPTVISFSTWLIEVANLICSVTDTSCQSPDDMKRKVVLRVDDSRRESQPRCPLCQSQHLISGCNSFIALSVVERWKTVKRLRLCFSCLHTGHHVRDCRVHEKCQEEMCKRKHHRLLHEYQSNPPENVLSCASDEEHNRKLLFRVLPVVIYGSNSCVETYALLDEGSSVTMIDSSLVQQLGVRGRSKQLNLSWYKGNSTKENATVVDIYISGIGKRKRHLLENVYGIPNLNLPTQSIHKNDIGEHLRQLPIKTYVNAVPKVLIGMDHCHLGLPDEIVPVKNNSLYAANTPLGWMIFGKTNALPADSYTCLFTKTDLDQSLHDTVANYFQTENFGVKSLPLVESKDDMRAKDILRETTKKVGGRFEARLLWRRDDVVLPDSYDMALRRLVGVERRIKRDEKLKAAYQSTIDGYVSKKYARKLTPIEVADVGPRTWYLPHFAVFNPNKPGKFRLVFDAAATVSGESLNSKLLKGPQQYPLLPSILFNFRIGAIAVCADIKEMFHQILIAPEDRSSQRFLWRNLDDTRQPDVFEMRVMTFGASCSPCTANFVKITNALEHIEKHPRAVKSIVDYHYVDDFVDSFETPAEAVNISRQVRAIHKLAGFELRNFISNSSNVTAALESTPGRSNGSIVSMCKETTQAEKVLGMYWEPNSDTFQFQLKFPRVKNDIMSGYRCPTKRELLSVIMSFYDPLGFLCNYMITAKLMMREVWRYDKRWDEPLPPEIQATWYSWIKNLNKVIDIRIPRRYFTSILPRSLELHTFVDASNDAFAAASYWRTTFSDSSVEVVLVCAKTRCAPLKPMTIPRMELQAAVLGTRLMCTILEEHKLSISRCFLWSDSSTVISWINSDSRQYKPFVAHRITEILESTGPTNWRWLPTRLNVADDATRAHSHEEFGNPRWFCGPSFLRECEEFWPVNNAASDNHRGSEELRPKFTLLISPVQLFDWDRFSSFMRLKRAVAWVLRFVQRCRKQYHNKLVTGLAAHELEKAEIIICRLTQRESYADEINMIRKRISLPKGNELYGLSPYLDNDGVLRVYGRIGMASWLPYETKWPIIVAASHPLALLIVRHVHHRMKHQNFEATICEIRRRFWIPRLRRVLRNLTSRCNVCKLFRAVPTMPFMGSLPEDRLTPYVRPFSFVGLDYFGPVMVTVGRRHEKRWVALFTCLTIRAVHLEIAYDLSTDACILAIRNFINRRGVPTRLRSDNGKNFVGADRESKKFSEVFDVERVQGELSVKGIEWEFNCPHNPSEGGVWERMVQCIKKVLRHTLNEIAPREHTLYSLLLEAENIVNSRPLTHLPVDSEEEEPLTPNHFLLGSANTARTSAEIDSRSPLALRKQWRISRQLRDRFWKRWILEYLPTLTRRSKWCQRTIPIKIGDLVLVCEHTVPRKQWKRGRVEKVYEGSDGVIRRVDVRTSSGSIRRPVSKLAVLDFEK